MTCATCDDTGKCWNNADPTSGQWMPCECGADKDAIRETRAQERREAAEDNGDMW